MSRVKRKYVNHCTIKCHDSEWFPLCGFCYTFLRTYTNLPDYHSKNSTGKSIYVFGDDMLRSVMRKSHLIQFTHLHDLATSVII